MSLSHPLWGAGLRVTTPPAAHPPDEHRITMPLYSLAVDWSKGGAVTSLFYKGQELISNQSAGDQWQVPVHVYDGVRWSNPTQAGGQGWHAWVPSLVVHRWATATAVEAIVRPMEWERDAWGGETMWPSLLLGHRLDLDYGGLGGLIRHEAIIHLPLVEMDAGEHRWLWSIAHTMPLLAVPWRMGPSGPVAQSWRVVPPHHFERCPESHQAVQSAILASADGAHALGVVAVGDYNHSDMSLHPRAGGTADCSRLGVARDGLPLPRGQSRYVSWWAVGDLERTHWLLRQAARYGQGGTLCPPGRGLVR